MKLIDITVPFDSALPADPTNTPFSLEAIKRIARGEMYCLPLRIVGADGAPARVVLRKS